jgi:hypothetical protein
LETETPWWVPIRVLDRLRQMERAPTLYTQSDFEAAGRLIRDPAMRAFYVDPWFSDWQNPDCWGVWFDFAWHAASYQFAEARSEKRQQFGGVFLSGICSKGLGDIYEKSTRTWPSSR